MRGVRRGRAAVAGLALALVAFGGLGACGDDEPAKAKPRATASRTPTPTSTVKPADPDHAVDPPGPFQAPVRPHDILVFSRAPLSPDMIRRIKKLKGVAAAEQISMASVQRDGQVFNVAAVNPATFRNWTGATTAQQQEVWDRVAGGEVALPPATAKALEDDDNYVQLRQDGDTKIHVGAYADLVPYIDMVFNEAWADDLNMIEGNALLLSTGSRSPQSVRKPIKRIVRDANVSIQMLDVVARLGLDPKAKLLAVPTGGSVSQAVGPFSYRVVGGRVIPDAAWVRANIRTEEVPILGRLTCHRAMFPQLRAALREVVEQGLSSKVYQTAGCYYPRFIANTTSLSNHAFGIAIDINSAENGRGTVGQMDRQVVAIFKRWGFGWGGDWKWTDPMHFELTRIVEAR